MMRERDEAQEAGSDGKREEISESVSIKRTIPLILFLKKI